MNKIPMPDLSQLHGIAEEEQSRSRIMKKYTLIHICNSTRKIKTTLILLLMWCVTSVVYYGLTFGARNLVGNMYLNISLSGLVEIVQIPFVIFINHRIGRRWSCFAFYAITSAACITVAVCAALGVSDLPRINFAMALTARLTISGGWVSLKVFAGEHYPTVVRTLGLGACNIAAGVGSIIAPYFVFMTEQELMIPYIIIGVLVLLNAGLPFLLKETSNAPLEDVFDVNNDPVVSSSSTHT